MIWWDMKINSANKLTILRVILIPIFVFLYMVGSENSYSLKLLATIIFILASITDYFDGIIARKYNLVTNFGKLLDPLADKMLVISSLLLITVNGDINVIFTLVIVLREIIISAIRLIALEQGEVIAASKIAKYKTATQMIAMIMIMLDLHKINTCLYVLTYLVFYISFVLTVLSLLDYIIKSKNVILKNGL